MGAFIIGYGLLAACAVQTEQPTLAEETAYQDRLPPQGESVEYYLHTHCGLRPIMLGGQWWHPLDPDRVDEADLDDYERGTLTVTSKSQVTFDGDEIQVEFEPGRGPRTSAGESLTSTASQITPNGQTAAPPSRSQETNDTNALHPRTLDRREGGHRPRGIRPERLPPVAER